MIRFLRGGPRGSSPTLAAPTPQTLIGKDVSFRRRTAAFGDVKRMDLINLLLHRGIESVENIFFVAASQY
jgi:hypothetical protein